MRACVVVFCVVALAALTIASPRRARQSNTDDDDFDGIISELWGQGGNRPIQQRPTRPTRPNRPTRPTRPTRPIPTQAPTSVAPPNQPSQAAITRCMRNCLRTPQYDPVCVTLTTGTRKTYSNNGERMCAEFCGETSTVLFQGSCSALV